MTKNDKVQIRVSSTEKRAIKDLAVRNGKSISEFVRDLIRQHAVTENNTAGVAKS